MKWKQIFFLYVYISHFELAKIFERDKSEGQYSRVDNNTTILKTIKFHLIRPI